MNWNGLISRLTRSLWLSFANAGRNPKGVIVGMDRVLRFSRSCRFFGLGMSRQDRQTLESRSERKEQRVQRREKEKGKGERERERRDVYFRRTCSSRSYKLREPVHAEFTCFAVAADLLPCAHQRSVTSESEEDYLYRPLWRAASFQVYAPVIRLLSIMCN